MFEMLTVLFLMPNERRDQCSASCCPDTNTQRLTAKSGNSANLIYIYIYELSESKIRVLHQQNTIKVGDVVMFCYFLYLDVNNII